MKPKKNNSDDKRIKAIETEDTVNGETLGKVSEESEIDTLPETSEKESPDLMYIGPELPGLVKHAVVFKNGILPEKVNRAIENYKPMKELFVTLEQMPAAIKEIKLNDGPLALIYKNVPKNINRR